MKGLESMRSNKESDDKTVFYDSIFENKMNLLL